MPPEQVPLAPVDSPAAQDHKDPREPPEQVPLVSWAQQDHKDPQVALDHRDPQDHKDPQVPLE